MSIEKSNLLKYLADISTQESGYHNHKETIGWAGLVLFFIFVTELLDKVSCKPLATAVLILVAFAVWCVLRVQYTLRKESASLVAACYRLSAEILPKDDGKIAKDYCFNFPITPDSDQSRQMAHRSFRLTLVRLWKIIKRLWKIIKFLLFFGKAEDWQSSHYRYILPKFLDDEMKVMGTKGHVPRIILEVMSYLLILGGITLGLLKIYYKIY